MDANWGGQSSAVTDIAAALAAIREAYSSGADELAKATGTFTQPGSATTGLQTYNLEPAAKNLYPVYSPFRNRIPRAKTTGGTQANWKGVTAIDAGNLSIGVGEGNRGGLQQIATQNYYAMFKTIGLESSVTKEAELSAEGFDDLKARAVRSNLEALMMKEERMIFGGNASYALGQTPTPTVTNSTTGGSIGNNLTVSVVCVALTMEGLQLYSSTGGPQWMVTRANVDGSTDTYGGGAAMPSLNTTVNTDPVLTTNKITAQLTAGVVGAVAYAWYLGTTVGLEQLSGITSASYATFTSLPTSGITIPTAARSTDASQNQLGFDGYLSLNALTTGANWYALPPGNTLHSDGSGGIVEFDTILQWYWDVLRMSPSRIVLQSTEAYSVRKAILASSASGASSRFTFYVTQDKLTGGSLPKGYLNMFANGTGPTEIPLEIHPYCPPGTILFVPDELPYAMNNVSELQRILCRQDYYSYDWPQRTRKFEYGLYSDEVLQHYFPISIGVISNITPGITQSP